MKFKLLPVLMVPALLLAACGDEAGDVDTSETGGKAAGEVLGGTISDEMLPLEELKSTSPPAARSSGGAGAGEDGDSAETPEAEAPSEAPAPETAE